MEICIIGWYGTETLGDRAILIGIMKVLKYIDEKSVVHIGSLLPFFTKRTLSEDAEIYSVVAPEFQITVFDSRDPIKIKEYVKKSDLVVMGGGPLLDITEIEIVKYTFELGKKLGKKTMIFGCGIGPLVYKQNRKIVADILMNTDLAIFRDERGVEEARLLNQSHEMDNIYYAHDPAILSIMDYKVPNKQEFNDTICINCRKFPSSAFGGMKVSLDESLIKMIQCASEQYKSVKLIPMHTFYIGGDDRKYLSELCLGVNKSNVFVQHKPMNLYELFDIFATSAACIGMRYHSVVLQTLLNGNNFILDYTEIKKGKINGFLNMINSEYYNDRIINLQSSVQNMELFEKCIYVLKENKKFAYSDTIFTETLDFYKEKIVELME